MRESTNSQWIPTYYPEAARFSGTVRDDDDKPAASANILVLDQASESKAVSADQQGGFEIKRLAPGNYRIFAWDEIEYLAWENSEALSAFESKSARRCIHC